MTLIRVMANLLCPTESDATSVRDVINQKLATKPVTVNAAPVVTQSLDGTWKVTADVAFILRLDAEDVRDDIVTKWGSGQYRNKIIAGSTVTLHVCAHNDGEPAPWQSCRERQFELRTKG